MNYLGLDLSLSNSGIAVIDENNNIIYQTTIPTSPKLSESSRIMVIGNTLEFIITEYKPILTCIENTFRGPNPRTKQILDHVAGMARFILGKYNCEYYFLSTCTMKGYILQQPITQPKKKKGQPKPQKIDYKELTRLNIIERFNLDKKLSNDVADALALALCARDGIKDPEKVKKVKKSEPKKTIKKDRKTNGKRNV